jgi:hypothetical protein
MECLGCFPPREQLVIPYPYLPITNYPAAPVVNPAAGLKLYPFGQKLQEFFVIRAPCDFSYKRFYLLLANLFGHQSRTGFDIGFGS